MDDGIGKEVVTRVKSTIQNNKKFYTDSSGRDFIERVCCFLTLISYLLALGKISSTNL